MNKRSPENVYFRRVIELGAMLVQMYQAQRDHIEQKIYRIGLVGVVNQIPLHLPMSYL